MTYEKCAPELLLKKLVGTWKGLGNGSYPEIGEFEYSETIEFKNSMKGFLIYTQNTLSLQGSAMHQELGYLRVDEVSDTIELVIVQPTGIAEVLVGKVMSNGEAYRFDLQSTAVVKTPSAKEVTRAGRYFHLSNDELSYRLYMEAVGQEYQLHLEASLVRS
ncbi:MAG: FABP family protein [Actinobacteria bacterium]|nr:FABP family protein [Actinomycetota bacterium]